MGRLQVGVQAATSPELSVEVVARPVEGTALPGMRETVKVCEGEQLRSLTVPSGLKERSWNWWPWAAVRVPVRGAVETRSAMWR